MQALAARHLGITTELRVKGPMGTAMHEDKLASKLGCATDPKSAATWLLTWSGRALTGAAGMAGK